jgi:hypothetical protein
MSKHNNSLGNSSKRRCNCGRYMTLGEDHAGMGVFSYECPDCIHRKYAKPLSSEEYYKQFENMFKNEHKEERNADNS